MHDFLVLYDKVREQFFDEKVELGHALGFSYSFSQVIEEFEELLICEYSVISVSELMFDIGNVFVDSFHDGELFFMVALIFSAQIVIVFHCFTCKLQHIANPLFRVLTTSLERFELLLNLFSPNGKKPLHLGNVVFVACFVGEWMFIEEIANRVNDNTRSHGFTMERTPLRLAFVVVIACLEVVRLVVFRGDTGTEWTVALATNHHLPHEVCFHVALLPNALREPRILLDAPLLIELVKLFRCHDGYKVVVVEKVFNVVAKNQNTQVNWCLQYFGDKLDANFHLARFSMRRLNWKTLGDEKICNFLK